jgi:hypothetical protein
MTNDEARMTKEAQMTNDEELPPDFRFGIRCFVIVSSFGNSSFGIASAHCGKMEREKSKS